jgi:hypothetical protein
MLTREERMDILRMGCLRDDTGFTREQQKEIIRKALEEDDIPYGTLKKLLSNAVPGVEKHGFLVYFLDVHNSKIKKLESMNFEDRKNPEIQKCEAVIGDIIGKTDSKYVVRTVDNREIITDSEAYPGIKVIDDKDLKVGSHVMMHWDTIRKVLDENRYKEALNISNKYSKDV